MQKIQRGRSEWIKSEKSKPVGLLDLKNKAKEVIPELLKQDPQAFGFFERKMGTQRYISATKKEGINLNYTGVRRALGDLGIVQKMPKLRAQGSMVKNYKKRREIRRYKQIAAALLKKR